MILSGLAGGLLGGMGFGGGTVLIPMLVFLCGLSQHTSQAFNLAMFSVVSILAIVIHIKNKLIVMRGVWWMFIAIAAVAFGFSFVSRFINASYLQVAFGIFLIATSAVLFSFSTISGYNKV